MSAKVYYVPGQTEGRRKAFLVWESIDLSSKLSLNVGVMLTITKLFIILFLFACGNREHPGNFNSLSFSSPFNSIQLSFQLSV